MFKFRDEIGLNTVMEKGPWMVRNKPLFVQKWSSEIIMQKVEPRKMPVWVKINNVPLEAWSVKGISALASGLGILMDTITAKMCHKGIGSLGFARVLVEMDAAKDLKTKIEIQYTDKSNNIKGKVFEWGAIDSTMDQPDENPRDNVRECTMPQQERNPKFVEQGQRKLFQNQRQNNGPWRMGKPENIKQEYRKRQRNGENNEKSKQNNKFNNNKWKVGNNSVNNIRTSANKFSILESLPEDNEAELKMLKEKIIVDKFLVAKIQPTVNESITWSKDMIEYFKVKWAEIKENKGNDTNDGSDMEDVIEINKGSTSILRENEISVKFDFKCLYTFVYAANDGIDRINLWEELIHENSFVDGKPWCLAEDLNVTLQPNEHSCRSSVMTSDMLEFQECLNNIEVEDICSSGLHYTWTKNLQKTKAGNMIRILKKLDRVMSNGEFMKTFPYAHAKNSSLLLVKNKGKIFMDVLCIKLLKSLKSPLSKLAWCKGNLHKRVESLRAQFQKVQTDIDNDPFSHVLRDSKANLPVKEVEDCATLFQRRLSPDVSLKMVNVIFEKEIKHAMFDINDSKALEPDGFTAAFF
ncbi:RNA-directed DNA polymerase, eukaryota, reverse transcriptase zinc-binding domain protein, partial [Tanacetum coccineum]